MTATSTWNDAENTMKAHRSSNIGGGLIALSVFILLGAVVLVAAAIGSGDAPPSAYFVAAAIAVQALFVAAIGTAVQYLASIATTNASIAINLVTMTNIQSQASQNTARTVQLLEQAVGYQQGG